MERIELVRLSIDTGLSGLREPVRLRFNGFDLEMNRISGGTGPGESWVGEFLVGSVGHEVHLMGPIEGPAAWEIRSLTVELVMVDRPPMKWQGQNLRLAAGGHCDLLGGSSAAFEV